MDMATGTWSVPVRPWKHTGNKGPWELLTWAYPVCTLSESLDPYVQNYIAYFQDCGSIDGRGPSSIS